MKKILVISDNHGYTHQLREVIDREMPFDLFLHCGDGECSKSEYEAGKQGAQLVCYGHTHRAEIHETDGMTFVNPGSFTGYHSPTRSTYAVVEIEDGQVLHAEIKHTEI